MNRRQGYIIICLTVVSVIVLSIVGCDVARRASRPQGTVIAEYNWHGKQYITLEEMEQKISEMPVYRRDRYKDKTGKEKYLKDMIEESLKYLAARSAGLHEEPEIKEKIDEYRHQLVVEKLATQEIDEKVTVSDEDKRKYYEEHKSEYVEPEKVRLTAITLEDEKRAQKVFRQIRRGEKTITQAAKELSEMQENVGPGGNNNGDTGFFTPKSFSWAEEFSKALANLKVGQMTSKIVVQEIRGTPNYMFFRKEEIQPSRQKTLEEVNNNVERSVRKEHRKARLKEWVDGLRAQANLKEYPERIPTLPKAEEETETETGAEEEAKQAEESEESKQPEGTEAKVETETPEGGTESESK